MVRKGLQLRNRRGATLAVVAVSLVALLSIMALAIDMGMMYSARNEAQRVADASALAGASAFIDPQYPNPAAAVQPARNRALEYVRRNNVLAQMVDSAEATIEVDPNRRRVRVTIRREQISTWFARMFGVDLVAVQASAAAEASDAGAARCVVPWAMQDMWFEDGARPQPDDRFQGDPDAEPSDCRGTTGDCYKAATTLGDLSASGYGRDISDAGADLRIKTQRPAQGGDDELAQPGPGEFMIWQMPPDSDLESCTPGGGQPTSQAYTYKNSICSCNHKPIELGVEYEWKPGNTVGPTETGIEGLFDQVEGGRIDYDTWLAQGSPADHPQVRKMGLIAPLPPPPGPNWNSSNMPPVVFTNFVMIFLENYVVDRPNQTLEIVGKFLYPAPGEAGETTGSLVRYLRLVE